MTQSTDSTTPLPSALASKLPASILDVPIASMQLSTESSPTSEAPAIPVPADMAVSNRAETAPKMTPGALARATVTADPVVSFEDTPLHTLLDKTPSKMTDAERIAFANELQRLRKNPQALGAKIRQDEETMEAKAVQSGLKAPRRAGSGGRKAAPINVMSFLS